MKKNSEHVKGGVLKCSDSLTLVDAGMQVQCVTTWRSDDKWFVTVRHLSSDIPTINCFVSLFTLLTYLLA